MDPLACAAALGVALAVDRWFGEPRASRHPVVWMGRYLEVVGGRIAPPAGGPAPGPAKEFTLGMAAWLAGALVVTSVAYVLQQALLQLPVAAAALLAGLALKPLLSWRMLAEETAAVEGALADSLAAGRSRLARLVSRDVTALDEAAVRESAIESLAENLNDSVVAPVFWFVLLGLPGAALYRFANTADAMWGYRGERGGRVWEWAGKWSARADDVLSWLPARLSALLIALVQRGFAWRALRGEARRTPSPNSGWPMAAMALALGVSLRKPGVYVLNGDARSPRAADAQRAQVLASHAVGAMVALAAGTLVVLGWAA
ncbi:MAG TPA: adenosylcobinamide-phosphate synthase CbiB [Ramlibacter sp.]|jgi:adenosylcobinamide-phosphate synthase